MKHLMYSFFMFCIICIFAFINSPPMIEKFTPKIRSFYRPIIRNTRIASEGFYNKISSNIHNLFRKIGIM
jgi:hypothetical protein